MTLSDLYPIFKGHDIFNVNIITGQDIYKIQDMYKMELPLQWQTDRTSYMICRLQVPRSTTMNNPEPKFKVTPSVADWGDGVSASCTVGPIVR